MPERVVALSEQVSAIATGRVDEIRRVTKLTTILGVNASIEAARSNNAGFAVVAEEVRKVSEQIEALADRLHQELGAKTTELHSLGQKLVADIRGSRLADLSLGMIDIVDRNLYERSCDVRWWATDSAMVACANADDDANRAFASSRLGVILDSYTVYLDLWVADISGRVLANGRPRQYAVQGRNVSGEEWFQRGVKTMSGEEFVACDVATQEALGGAAVATYSTAIREEGRTNGRPIGVLGIFFDWDKQSQVVVDSVRMTDAERSRSRCMIVNREHKLIACNHRGDLGKTFALQTHGKKMGSYTQPDGSLVGFALTPGYETYQGLGWYGVIEQAGAS